MSLAWFLFVCCGPLGGLFRLFLRARQLFINSGDICKKALCFRVSRGHFSVMYNRPAPRYVTPFSCCSRLLFASCVVGLSCYAQYLPGCFDILKNVFQIRQLFSCSILVAGVHQQSEPTGITKNRNIPYFSNHVSFLIFLIFFFLIIDFTLRLNPQEVLTLGDILDKSRDHRCLPFFPPLHAFLFFAHRV